jgi:subtilisin family serine protease
VSHPQYRPEYVCNAKLIGAWDFFDGIRIEFPLAPGINGVTLENDGPVDNEGHGSGAASVSGGNRVAELNPASPAPRANLISYDTCGARFFLRPDGSLGSFVGGTVCSLAAILAALEQAALDGVDVINFSNTGGTEPWRVGDTDRAFLDLLTVGTLVAASAGNSSLPGTVQHLGPWTTTIGATNRIERQQTFASTQAFSGGALAPPAAATGPAANPTNSSPAGVPVSDVVYAGDLSCVYSGFGPPCEVSKRFCEQDFVVSEVRGKILVCDIAPTAGGNGIVPLAGINQRFSPRPASDWPRGLVFLSSYPDLGLESPDLEGQTSYSPNLPFALSLDQPDGDALRTWVRGGGTPRMGISALSSPPAPIETFVNFTSRGPGAFKVAKPNIASIGTEVLMANRAQQSFDTSPPPMARARGGTSFSTPFAAGVLALLKSAYPTLSPTERASLMLSSANTNLFQEGKR